MACFLSYCPISLISRLPSSLFCLLLPFVYSFCSSSLLHIYSSPFLPSLALFHSVNFCLPQVHMQKLTEKVASMVDERLWILSVGGLEIDRKKLKVLTENLSWATSSTINSILTVRRLNMVLRTLWPPLPKIFNFNLEVNMDSKDRRPFAPVGNRDMFTFGTLRRMQKLQSGVDVPFYPVLPVCTLAVWLWKEEQWPTWPRVHKQYFVKCFWVGFYRASWRHWRRMT